MEEAVVRRAIFGWVPLWTVLAPASPHTPVGCLARVSVASSATLRQRVGVAVLRDTRNGGAPWKVGRVLLGQEEIAFLSCRVPAAPPPAASSRASH